MNNVKLTISYDGTNYFGWQVQPKNISIQEVIENALTIILQKKIRLTGASRTDAKVHAKYQVANFLTEKNLNTNKILTSLNKLLPEDIRVINIEIVNNSFNARKDVLHKTYKYYIFNKKINSPFYKNYSWFIPFPINIDKLNNASSYLIGKKNFTSFTGQKASAKTFKRIVYNACWKKEGDFIVFTICANGFLKNMIRKIVGSLIAINNGAEDKNFIQYLLCIKDRAEGKYCAPPQGLFLERIVY